MLYNIYYILYLHIALMSVVENTYKIPTKDLLIKKIKDGWPNPNVENNKIDYLMTLLKSKDDLLTYNIGLDGADYIIPDVFNGIKQRNKIIELNTITKKTEVNVDNLNQKQSKSSSNFIILSPEDNTLLKYKIPYKIWERSLNDIRKYFKENEINDFSEKEINNFCSRLIWCLVHRYHKFQLWNGSSGSVTDEDYDYFNKLGADIECFASFFNRHDNFRYCGIFPDLEFIFGCIGNFFSVKFVSGKYVANPPYTNDIINKSIMKFVDLLNAGNNNIDVIFILPVWATSDRIILNKKFNANLQLSSDEYVLDKIRSTKLYNLVYYDQLLLKDKYKFFDHILDTHINYSHVNVISFCNKKGILRYKYEGDYIRL